MSLEDEQTDSSFSSETTYQSEEINMENPLQVDYSRIELDDLSTPVRGNSPIEDLETPQQEELPMTEEQDADVPAEEDVRTSASEDMREVRRIAAQIRSIFRPNRPTVVEAPRATPPPSYTEQTHEESQLLEPGVQRPTPWPTPAPSQVTENSIFDLNSIDRHINRMILIVDHDQSAEIRIARTNANVLARRDCLRIFQITSRRLNRTFCAFGIAVTNGRRLVTPSDLQRAAELTFQGIRSIFPFDDEQGSDHRGMLR